MALKSTIFKVELQLADVDHGIYTDHALTIARHPSETDERMMVRVAALALNAHAVQTLCGGDAMVGFGGGLSDPDDPDVSVTDFNGRRRVWIEVGQPDDKPLVRACSRADTVKVYAFAPSAEMWWRGLQGKVARLDRLEVWRLPAEATQQLAALVERSMRCQATLQDGALSLGSERGSVFLEPLRWQ